MDFELVPIVVVWHDAHTSVDGWVDRTLLEDEGPAVCTTTGFLLPTEKGGKKNHVSMVATWCEDDMVHSVFHIPLQMVQRIDVLARSHELANVDVFPTASSTIR